jgi:hypothetical protein
LPKFAGGAEGIKKVYAPYYDTDGTLIRNVDAELPELVVTGNKKDYTKLAEQERARQRGIAKSFLREGPSIGNLYNAADAAWKALTTSAADVNPYIQTGIAPSDVAFAAAPFMPKFILRKPVVSAKNSASLDTDGGVFKTIYQDVPPQALNDNINSLGESVYLYEHPETTGSVAGKLSSYLPNEWFKYNLQSLTGHAKMGFNKLTSLYKSPEYLQRVLDRFHGNLYERDMFLKGLEDRLANVKVSQPKHIIRKDGPGKYKYVDNPDIIGMSSGDRV